MIAAGQTKTTLSITAIDDEIKEAETVSTINLSVAGHAMLSESQITVRVAEDDNDALAGVTAATAALADDSLAEGDTTTLTVSLEEPLSTAATLTLILSDELISFSETENLNTRQIVFARGETEIAVAIAAADNGLADDDTRTATISFESQREKIKPVPDKIELSVKPDDEAVIAVDPEAQPP